MAVYHYFRSLAVDNPFTTARDNLIVAFEKVTFFSINYLLMLLSQSTFKIFFPCEIGKNMHGWLIILFP